MLMKLLTMQHKIMKMVCKMSAKDAYLSQTLTALGQSTLGISPDSNFSKYISFFEDQILIGCTVTVKKIPQYKFFSSGLF